MTLPYPLFPFPIVLSVGATYMNNCTITRSYLPFVTPVGTVYSILMEETRQSHVIQGRTTTQVTSQ